MLLLLIIILLIDGYVVYYVAGDFVPSIVVRIVVSVSIVAVCFSQCFASFVSDIR
jgi:hypothetical protein